METLVFFLVIGAIQIAVSWQKQKKERAEAARKAQQQPKVSTDHSSMRPHERSPRESTRPHEERPRPARPPQAAPPPVASPIPDPLRDLVRQFGIPVDEPAEHRQPPPVPAPAPTPRAERDAEAPVEARPMQEFVETKDKRKQTSPTAKAAISSTTEVADNGIIFSASVEKTAIEALGNGDIGQMDQSLVPNTSVKAEEVRKGFVLAAVLQEPRFRKPWRPAQI